MYLIQADSTLRTGYDGAFYVMCILPQVRTKALVETLKNIKKEKTNLSKRPVQ